MSKPKLLTPDEVIHILAVDPKDRIGLTLLALAERLANVELCWCQVCGDVVDPEGCSDCKDHPRRRHKDWKGALLKTGEDS